MTQTAKKSPFSMNVDLMHGPIFKNLLLFMLPIFISNLFQQLYNTVDTMIVGNVLGDTALAAIGSCGSIYELLVGFGLGIGNGLAIVAARSYGAQDHDLLKKDRGRLTGHRSGGFPLHYAGRCAGPAPAAPHAGHPGGDPGRCVPLHFDHRPGRAGHVRL